MYSDLSQENVSVNSIKLYEQFIDYSVFLFLLKPRAAMLNTVYTMWRDTFRIRSLLYVIQLMYQWVATPPTYLTEIQYISLELMWHSSVFHIHLLDNPVYCTYHVEWHRLHRPFHHIEVLDYCRDEISHECPHHRKLCIQTMETKDPIDHWLEEVRQQNFSISNRIQPISVCSNHTYFNWSIH